MGWTSGFLEIAETWSGDARDIRFKLHLHHQTWEVKLFLQSLACLFSVRYTIFLGPLQL